MIVGQDGKEWRRKEDRFGESVEYSLRWWLLAKTMVIFLFSA